MTARLGGPRVLACGTAALLGVALVACVGSSDSAPPPGSYTVHTSQVSTGGPAAKIAVASVEPSFFDWPPAATAYVGRMFVAEEYGKRKAGDRAVMILTHVYWDTQLGADPGVIGRSITVDGTAHTVVGILPPGAEGPEEAQLLLPAAGGG